MKNELKPKIRKGKNVLDDNMVTVINLKSKYVSDGIGEDYQDWDSYNPVFISSQTGTGKNFFTEKVIPTVKGEILIVSNRIANCRQQKVRIAELVGCSQELEYLTPKGLDQKEDFKNIKILTYQKLDSYISIKSKITKLKHYTMVIFDEAHFFLSDSLFNNKTSRILKNSLTTFKNSIRVYMTATDEEILPIIIEKEKSLWDRTFEALCSTSYIIKPKELKYYYFKRNYDYINSKYFTSKEEILEIIKNDKSENKWLVFVNSKEEGRFFVDQIGSNSVFITAESKDSELIDGEIYAEVVKHEKFSCKVLLTTSTLDNGVNFKDKLLKNIVIFSHDKTEFIQELGRKRITGDERVNLYICSRDSSYFNKRLRVVNSKIEAICCFKSNSSIFIDEYFFGEDISKYIIAKQLFYREDDVLQLNDLAEKKLYNDKLFMERMIREINSGFKEAFINEQLSWIGLEKTYNPCSWVSFTSSNDNEAKFIKFLNDNCNIEISGENSVQFKKDFKILSTMAYGNIKSDRNDRPQYGVAKMRKTFMQHNLNYNIEEHNKILTLEKI